MTTPKPGQPHDYDALIIGGGPAGSTTALVMARAGLKVCLLEKEQHPRFHIGESILPRMMPLLRELGIEDELKKLPRVPKYGAEFAMGNDPKTMQFTFTEGLLPGEVVFNIERSLFDKMLIDQARAAGATIFESTKVQAINHLQENLVEVATPDRVLSARLLMDASGQSTIVGRHLGQRRNFDEPELQNVSYYQHFDHVERPDGMACGHPTIVLAEEGWFWIIALNETKSSVGFVTRPTLSRQLKVPPTELLQWAIARCPLVRQRMQNALGPQQNLIAADFSYTCAPFAGPGFFLVGDAASFIDPIFSTGVTLAMVGGQQAGKLAVEMLTAMRSTRDAQRQYIQFIHGSTSIFGRLIRKYYRHSFRELFLNGTGPMRIHAAIISILAGQVFPRPVWALRWRMRLFEFCVWAQQYVELSPHRRRFKLMDEPPIALSLLATPIPA